MAEGKMARVLNITIVVIGCAMVFYHLISTQYLLQGFIEHQDTHLAFALILVFLSTLRAMKRRRLRPVVVALLLVGIFATAYFKIFFEHLYSVIGFATTMDDIVGILLIIVVFEATRQAFGPILPIVGVIFIAYFFFGHYIPGPLAAGYFEPKLALSWLCVGFSGIFGTILGVSANMIFLFIVFGGLIQGLGAFGFIHEICKWL